jgi:signal transduction histidine kinase
MDLELAGKVAVVTGASKGIGLAVARGIIEAHGGRIWLENVPAGGLTVAFTLPAESPPAPR